MQALCQVRNEVILEVLPDGLGLVIQDVFVLISVDFVALFRASSLLLLHNFLKVLFLFTHEHRGDRFLGNLSLVLEAAHLLFLLVIGHVVIWLLVPLDVNLESVECVLPRGLDGLGVDADSLSLEEVLHTGLSYDAVVCGAVSLKSSNHVIF